MQLVFWSVPQKLRKLNVILETNPIFKITDFIKFIK